MRWMHGLFQVMLTVGVVLVLGLPALCAPRLARDIAALATVQPGRFLCLAGGLAAGAIIYLAMRRHRVLQWLDTFQHERAHLVWTLLVGGTPSEFYVGRDAGGEVRYAMDGNWAHLRQYLISVAPYWFSPLLPGLLMLAVIADPLSGWVLVGTAMMLGASVSMPLVQINANQPDLRRYGIWPPIATALWLWTAATVLSLLVLVHGSVRWLPGALATNFWTLTRSVQAAAEWTSVIGR